MNVLLCVKARPVATEIHPEGILANKPSTTTLTWQRCASPKALPCRRPSLGRAPAPT